MLNLTPLRFAATPLAFSGKPNRPSVTFAASADRVQFGNEEEKKKKSNYYPGKMTWAEQQQLEKDLKLDDKTFGDKLEGERWNNELDDADINLINPDTTVTESLDED